MISNIASVRRQVKNVAYNYSDAQVKVREATSNDPWGATSTLMNELADMTYNTMAFTEIMQIVWKRLNDHGKNWRHVYKSLVLLDYLIKTGSDKVSQQCKENIYAIQTLKDFQFIEDNKDHGLNVREKAKQLVALLKDDERLKSERARALAAKKRFAQNGSGFGPDGTSHNWRSGDTFPSDDGGTIATVTRTRRGLRKGTSVPNLNRMQSELEEARPTSPGEEELQLQIALALSREEAQKEEEIRKGDEARLEMALNESKVGGDHPSGATATGASASAAGRSSSALDDLLFMEPAYGSSSNTGQHPPLMDPWGFPIAPPTSMTTQVSGDEFASNDPWGAPPAASNAAAMSSLQGDPWSPAPSVPQTHFNGNGLSYPGDNVQNNKGSDALWDMDSMSKSIAQSQSHNETLNNSANGSVAERKVKTPESFLGENSALVNLDNLMGSVKSANHCARPSSTNPFASTTAATSSQLSTGANNPFLAQQRPSPTLNQMRGACAIGTSLDQGAALNGAGQGQQQARTTPLQPTRAASTTNFTNPFL